MSTEPLARAAKPEFATNREGESVGAAISGHLQYLLDTWAKGFEVAIATAYFNPGGFGQLAPQLEAVESVRLLLGAEPENRLAGPRRLKEAKLPQQAYAASLRRALEGHELGIKRDLDLLGFRPESDVTARRLIEWLRSGRVEVRRYGRGFLHGKAFLVTTDCEGVIAGSANFTYAGLALNQELTLGHYQPAVVAQVAEWFEDLWEQSEEYDLASVYEQRYRPHDPYLIYLRMLYERYGPEVEAEAQGLRTGMRLTQFQEDGVWRAKRILEEHQGVVIADGVGLGKTFIAGAIIKEFAEQLRQRVLIIAPAALRDGPWASFLRRYDLPRGVQCVSYEQLLTDRQLRADGIHSVLDYEVSEYGLIVIDEAHGFRNPETLRADALRALLAGTPPKAVAMLTATPVNNGLFDLYHLLSYFVRNDAAFAHAGIRSLRDHFAEATAENPEDLSPDRLFDVLDAVAVRRTRRFVKTYYARDRIIDNAGNAIQITFPTVKVSKVGYDIDVLLPGLFARLAHSLDPDSEHAAGVPPDSPVLTLARYSPSRYLKSGAQDAYEVQLAGLLRSGLLKRFESSSHAFALTCRRMAESHKKFLALLDQGRVATGAALADWTVPEDDSIDELGLDLPGDSEPLDLYRAEELRSDVECDRELLLVFAEEAEQITSETDPKLAALVDELAEIARQARDEASSDEDERDRRKVIVFSYYTDTVSWIADRLGHVLDQDERLAAYRGRMTTIDGSSSADKTHVLYGFTPISSEAPEHLAQDLYDLVIATDVLAEGVNLQQARHVINYDLPWNPMRLVQRHGRIDRIGSSHDHNYIRCFFPDTTLDAILGLEEGLKRKLHQAAAAVGVEQEVLPGSKVSEIVFTETRDEIEKLRLGDASLFENAGERGHAYSGEEYRQELRAGLQDPELRAAVLALPWGSGSGLERPGGVPGFVFCARVADHPNALFRFVDASDLGDLQIAGDTLGCLAQAFAERITARSLPEETHLLAYRAWQAAREDIFVEWSKATDPAALAPKVPRVLREAAALLRNSPPPGLAREELTRLLDALEAPYPPRIQGAIRKAMAGDAPDGERAERVADEVVRLGLQPSVSPEPLPVITMEDVHLVCWQAITPAQRHEADGPEEAVSLLADPQTTLST